MLIKNICCCNVYGLAAPSSQDKMQKQIRDVIYDVFENERKVQLVSLQTKKNKKIFDVEDGYKQKKTKKSFMCGRCDQ